MGALEDIAARRERQVTVEGRTPEGDDTYVLGDLGLAAMAYVACGLLGPSTGQVPGWWPWERTRFKHGANRENLVHAGAFIVAEIERLDRASSRPDAT